MSKIALRRELGTMSTDQIRTLVLELYSRSKEAKEYLDFYLNPDISVPLDKARKVILKELSRIGRGMLRARSSILKKQVDYISRFSPGAEYEIEIRTFLLDNLIKAAIGRYITGAIANLAGKLVYDLVMIGHSGEMLPMVIPQIELQFERFDKTSYYVDSNLKAITHQMYAEALSQIASDIRHS